MKSTYIYSKNIEMKKIIILLLFFISSCLFSQNSVYKANVNEVLTRYFEQKISKDLLKNITYPKNGSSIEILFYVNKENIPYNIQISYSRNSNLNKALKKAFEEYPTEDLKINFDTKKKYSFQIIKRVSGSNVISVSNSFTEVTPPNCNTCKDLDFFSDIQTCINSKLKNYFNETIDYTLVNKKNKSSNISLEIHVFIDQNGFLKLKKLKVPLEFEEHIKHIVDQYPVVFTPKTVNNNSETYSYSFYQSFEVGKKPELDTNFNNFDSIFVPSYANKFAKYLQKNLTEKELNYANLNRINQRLSLYFELDKNGNLIEISTNSRSKTLEKKIITLFKKFDLNELNFINKNRLNRYFSPIIIFEDGKKVVKTYDTIGYSRIPIFSACKNVKTSKEAKACFSRKVQIHFSKKFNPKLINRLGLSSGRKRIFIQFRVDKKGNIADIKAKSPHKKIEEEVVRVMKTLPKASPAVFGNKPANIKFSIPFTIIVE